MSDSFLYLYQLLWRGARPLLFRSSPQQAHDQALALWRRLDDSAPGLALLRAMQRAAFATRSEHSLTIGGVHLPQPLILAAGMVKGDGFADEQCALAAVEERRNILPGWRSLPALAGPVEFGSCTRWPRLGNPGRVLWRDSSSRSTRNRVGLRNPGARAVAAFLAQRRDQLPPVWGLNIATSPGVDDIGQQREELLASLDFFLEAGVRPGWFTLNISCPNTGDDPRGLHSAALLRELCGPAARAADPTPLWIKIAPKLGSAQYQALPAACATAGVRAIVATNTLAQPAPGDARLQAGLGGEGLHGYAHAAQTLLQEELERTAGVVDLVACGGILDGASWRACAARAAQYWSALVWRGPLAAALILREGQHGQ